MFFCNRALLIFCIVATLGILVFLFFAHKKPAAIYEFGGKNVVVYTLKDINQMKHSSSAKDAHKFYLWYTAFKDEVNSAKWHAIWKGREKVESRERGQ